jgi:hypothetical protein
MDTASSVIAVTKMQPPLTVRDVMTAAAKFPLQAMTSQGHGQAIQQITGRSVRIAM